MNRKIEDLIRVFSSMTELYGEFLALLTVEQEQISRNQTEALRNTVIQKEELTEKIQMAEDKRLTLSAEVFQEAQLPAKGARIADLVARVSASEGRLLIEARDGLTTVVSRVKVLNEINHQLLQDSMDYVRHAVELVAGRQESRNGYGAKGAVSKSVNVQRNFVNTKA